MALAKGQSSMEALAAFAALLACIAVLIAASKPLAGALLSSFEEAAARIALSSEAYAIDSSCSLSHASMNATVKGAILQGGGVIAHRGSPRVKERLLCKSSSDYSGGIYAQNSLEPV
jgi:hypothetical protein